MRIETSGEKRGLRWYALARPELGDTRVIRVGAPFEARYQRLAESLGVSRRIETQTGALVSNFLGVKDPPIIELVADMAVGRRWRSGYTNTLKGVVSRAYYDSKVVALEDLDLPLGRVRAFRVRHEGEALQQDGRRSVLHRMSWIDTASGLVVRNDNRFVTPADGQRRTEEAWHQSSTRLAKLERKPR